MPNPNPNANPNPSPNPNANPNPNPNPNPDPDPSPNPNPNLDQAEQARLREQLAVAQRQEGARQEERLAQHVSEYEGAVGELRCALLASFHDEQQVKGRLRVRVSLGIA